MGFRTVVVLSNDRADEWMNDPDRGKNIMTAASLKSTGYADKYPDPLPYGEIIEQVHADEQSVVFFDGYRGEVRAHGHWHRGQTQEQKDEALLKALADKLGYRVLKKPAPKA